MIALLLNAAGRGLGESENRKGLEPNIMSCRIERRVNEEDFVVLRVSGRIHGEHVDTLRELVGGGKGGVAIDLEEVTLVDREAVRLLTLAEANGIELRNCPAYIQEWVAGERTRTGAEL